LKFLLYHVDWEQGSTILDWLLASYDLDEELSTRTSQMSR